MAERINPVQMGKGQVSRPRRLGEPRTLKPVIKDSHADFMDMRPVFREPVSDPKDLSAPESASDLPTDSQPKPPETGDTGPSGGATTISPPAIPNPSL